MLVRIFIWVTGLELSSTNLPAADSLKFGKVKFRRSFTYPTRTYKTKDRDSVPVFCFIWVTGLEPAAHYRRTPKARQARFREPTATPLRLAQGAISTAFSKSITKTEKVEQADARSTFYLSDWTWTSGLYHPKVARSQLRHTQIFAVCCVGSGFSLTASLL